MSNMKKINQLTSSQKRYFKTAFNLAVFTIVYNFLEGIISLFYGTEDGSLTLFGFGADSIIEVISGIGIAIMILRIRDRPQSDQNNFEKRALQITGIGFYVLVAALLIMSVNNIITRHKPAISFSGIIISIISISVMWALMTWKLRTGRSLNSDAIIADANCSKVCLYMSVILLVGSILYHYNIAYIDIVGSLGLAYFSYKEGKECFEKAKNNKHCCCN